MSEETKKEQKNKESNNIVVIVLLFMIVLLIGIITYIVFNPTEKIEQALTTTDQNSSERIDGMDTEAEKTENEPDTIDNTIMDEDGTEYDSVMTDDKEEAMMDNDEEIVDEDIVINHNGEIEEDLESLDSIDLSGIEDNYNDDNVSDL